MWNATETASGGDGRSTRVESGRQPESLDGARSRFAKLLRTRIAETERTLAMLRAELASIGGTERKARPRQPTSCAGCGQTGHTKRTCQEVRGAPGETRTAGEWVTHS